MKIEKGKAGYIDNHKKRYLTGTIIEFAVVILIFIIGIIIHHHRLNMFTLIAVLGCLPASKVLVQYIVIAKFKSLDSDKAEEIADKIRHLTVIYDVALSTTEKIMFADVLVVTDNLICGYVGQQTENIVKLQDKLKTLLDTNHYNKMTVKLFDDYVAFVSRAEGLESMAEVSKQEVTRKQERIKALILTQIA